VGDNAISLEAVNFDATKYVLKLPLKKLQAIRDCHETSDRIGQAHVDHDGPCSVYLEDTICEFFNVTSLKEIDAELLRKARAWLKSARKSLKTKYFIHKTNQFAVCYKLVPRRRLVYWRYELGAWSESSMSVKSLRASARRVSQAAFEERIQQQRDTYNKSLES
jgi:hypothetical protein